MADNDQSRTEQFAKSLATQTSNAYVQLVNNATVLDNLQDSFEALLDAAEITPATKQWASIVLNDLKNLEKMLPGQALSRMYNDANSKVKKASIIDKLIVLADKLDSIGFIKDADNIDRLVSIAVRDNQEDFNDLTNLWSGKLDLKDTEESVPVRNRLTNVPEDYEILTPLEDPDMRPEEEARLSRKVAPTERGEYTKEELEQALKTHKALEQYESGDEKPENYPTELADIQQMKNVLNEAKTDRLHEIKRRHELLKLKKMFEQMEESPEEKQEGNKESVDISDNDEIDKALGGEFPEDAFEDESQTMNNADDGLIDQLKEKLKGSPELAMKVLMLIKDNPELLELLAL